MRKPARLMRRWMKYAVRAMLLVVFLLSVAEDGKSAVLLQQNDERAQKDDQLDRDEIRTAEQQLAELGYWSGKIDGTWDSSSRYALVAFQKVEGRERTGKLTRTEYAAILLANRPLPRESHYAHIEVDLRRQIVFQVEASGAVSHILPISSGNGEFFTSEGYTRRAVTPVGRFTVFSKIKGWRKSPLGLLYYPNYIVGGVAIHGSPSVPTRPASHGCIRIPMFAAEEFSRLTPLGTRVIVYDELPAVDQP